jgi:hypothetical protein
VTCIATAILITYAIWDAGLLSVYMFYMSFCQPYLRCSYFQLFSNKIPL